MHNACCLLCYRVFFRCKDSNDAMAELSEGHGAHDELTARTARRPRWCLLRLLELCPLLLLSCPSGERGARYDAASSVVLLSLGALGGARAQGAGKPPPPPTHTHLAGLR